MCFATQNGFPSKYFYQIDMLQLGKAQSCLLLALSLSRKRTVCIRIDLKAAYFEDKFESNTNILNYTTEPPSRHMYCIQTHTNNTITESQMKPKSL